MTEKDGYSVVTRREKVEDGQWWFRGPDILHGAHRVLGITLGTTSISGHAVHRVRIPKRHGGIAYAYLFNDLHRMNPKKWSLEVLHSILDVCEDKACHTPSTTSVYGYPKTHQVGDIPGYPIKPEVVEDPSVYELPDFYQGWLRPTEDQGPTLRELMKAAQEAGMEVSMDVSPRDGGGTFAIMDVETKPPYTGVAAEPDPRTLDEAAKEGEARTEEQPDPAKVYSFINWKADPEVGALFDGTTAVRSSLAQRVDGIHKGISEELQRLTTLVSRGSAISHADPFEVARLYVDRFRRELLGE